MRYNSDMLQEEYDLISVGDTTTDVFIRLNDASVLKRPKKRGDALCVRFADKIAVADVKGIDGVGNAANVAVGSSRLGLKTGIWTILGNDDNADRIATDVFEKEKVDQICASRDKKHRTNFSVVLNFKAERTILVYHAPRVYKWPKDLPSVKWLYFTSMGEGWEKVIPGLKKYCRETGIKIAFNPGTYQLRSSTETLRKVLAETSVLFVNHEEAEKISGIKGESIKLLLTEIQKLGPKTVVITDGDKGAFAVFENEFLHMPILPVPIVERTGCGDSFAAGFLTALSGGQTFSDALVWGAINSSSVIQFVGAREGLITKERMNELFAKVTIKPEKI